jgi:3-oxoacyl-[acyl-carrier-protein] synthase II
MKTESLFITGCGVATALGCNHTSFITNLMEGKANFRKHRQLENLENWNPQVAYIDDEILNEGINSRILRKLDRFSLLSLQTFQQTLKHAALNDVDVQSFGILLGNSTGGWTFVESQMEDIYKGNYDTLSPYVATAWFPTAPQGEISIQSKVSGYSKTFAADALSSGYALEHACYLIKNDYLPGAFVGGVEAPLSPLVYNSCIRYEPLSPSGNYLPFHPQSDGYVLGEGAGLLAVEASASIQKRNGKPLARIAGLGIGSSLSEAIQACLQEAERLPKDVDCIFLDAKGIATYDDEEYAVLDHYFHSCNNLYLTTTKTLHGSLLAADFAVQLAVAVLALVNQKIPVGLYSKNHHHQPPFGQLVIDHSIDTKLNNILLYARNLDGSSIVVLIENGSIKHTN